MPTASLSSFCGLDRETRDSCTGGRDTEVTAKTRFSDFADGECGEPFTPHHLHLDFTPDTEVDTPLVQQKIIDFWDFVNSTPELQHMLMKPDKCMSIVSAISEVKITSPSKPKLHKEEVVEMDHTAISSLGLFSKPGVITETPSMHTSLSPDSKENNLDIILSGDPLSSGTSKAGRPQKSTKKAKKLCKILNDWDNNHPKSMDPPGHPPRLEHCVIQRQVWGDYRCN
ncbi:unnamed protein product [Spodoptera littoralis]|uniref:Uncharacterized protein n=1 Tax=Spodoptera littoralis TaxID=7109 RepID=A0A9P0IES1_SPOLI|nr:unnamed protein product [Spodoptera littoralis]CAH1645775.1 unnamed protein product [Spodoptera littoralis]